MDILKQYIKRFSRNKEHEGNGDGIPPYFHISFRFVEIQNSKVGKYWPYWEDRPGWRKKMISRSVISNSAVKHVEKHIQYRVKLESITAPESVNISIIRSYSS